MWKKIRIPLLVFLVLVAAVLFFSFKIDFLAAPVRLVVYKATGEKPRIGKVEYRLFNRVTFRDVELGDYFRCRDITVSLDLARVLMAPRHLQQALTRIQLTQPAVVVTPSFLSTIKKVSTIKTPLSRPLRLMFSWKDGAIVTGKYRIAGLSGQWDSGTVSAGSTTGTLGSLQLFAQLRSRSERSQTTGTALLKATGPGTHIETTVNFARRAGGTVALASDIGRFSWKGITADHSTFRVNSSSSGFSVVLQTPGGSLAARGPSADSFAGEASFDLAPFAASSSGTVSARFSVQDSSTNAVIRCADLSYKQRLIGTLSMAINGSPGRIWNAQGDVSPAGYRFKALLSPSRELMLSFEKGKSSGTVKGLLSPLALDVNVADWPIDNAPFLSSSLPSLKGFLSVSGSLTAHDTQIQLRGTGWEMPSSRRFDWSGSLLQTDGTWFVKLLTSDGSLQAKARRFSDGQWDAAASLSRIPLRDILAWKGVSREVSGTLSADISYASRGEGKAQVTASNVVWAGGRADAARFDFLITPQKAELIKCAVRCPGGSVTAKGTIERAPDKPREFSCDLTINDFPLYGHPAKGAIQLTGELTPAASGYCEGKLEGNRISWGPWTGMRIVLPFYLDKERFEFKDLHWDRMVRGSAAFRRLDRSLSGGLTLAGLPLQNISSQMKGDISGKLSFSGSLESPRLTLDYSANNLSYREVAGKANGALFWQNNKLSTSHTVLSIGAGSIDLSGTLWPSLSATAELKALPFAAARAAGVRGETLKGDISGILLAHGPFNNPDFSASITGCGLSAGTLVVDDLVARVSKKSTGVIIDTFTATAGDAELSILQGSSIDIGNHTFSLRSDWRNIDTGVAVVFGALSCSGSWGRDKANAPFIAGSLTTDNFWINEHHMQTAAIGMRYRDKVLSFEPVKGQPFGLTGSVDLSRRGVISFRDLTIDSGGKTVNARGAVDRNKWDLALSVRRADAGTLGEILGLPVMLTGSVTADITGRGSLDAPDLNVSLSVADGSIEDLPFDSLIVKGSAKNDSLALEEARLSRKNQYSAIARGNAPFYLTGEAKKRVLDRPLDLTFRIEQGTLNLLTALTRDIRSGTGKVNAEARLTGTLAHPLADGYIKVNNGELTGRRYFSRITEMDVDFEWKGTVLEVKTLTGKVGPGRLNVGGAIEFDGFAPSRYNLSFQTEGRKGIAISVPELPIPSAFLKTQDWDLISNLSHGEPRVKITFSGPAHNPVLAGWVELEDTRFTYPSVAKPRDGESILAPLWPKMSWNLELRSGRNTWYDNELVSVMIQGGLRLTGRGLAPYAYGKVEAVRGTINYLGREFTIKQAQLEIVKDKAFLEGEASTDIYDNNIPGQNDTIQMYIDKAEIGRISPRFVSKGDPELPPEQALARATGINPERFASADQNFLMRQQLIRLFDSTLTTPLARSLLRKSGLVDSFRVKYVAQEPIKPADPDKPTLTELLYGTKYSLEKYLTTQMLFGYSMTFDQLQNKLDLRHELELSYQLNRGLFLRGSYELNTSENPFRQYDRRITLEQQFRFGFTPRKKKP